MAADKLAFQLEHHHGYGLFRSLDRIGVRITAGSKGRQRAQADAVATLQHVRIVIAQAIAHHGGNAGFIPQGRAHPQYIVIAPLDIHRRMLHQEIQNRIRAVATVKKVPHNMQPVHRQPLNQHRKRLDKIRAAVNLHDGIE